MQEYTYVRSCMFIIHLRNYKNKKGGLQMLSYDTIEFHTLEQKIIAEVKRIK